MLAAISTTFSRANVQVSVKGVARKSLRGGHGFRQLVQCRDISRAAYTELYKRSIENREQFWADAASEIKWIQKYDRVLDSSDAPCHLWFPGGQLNMCYNAVDRHVDEGHGDRIALIYDSPVTGQKRRYSYAELQEEVANVAGAIASKGVVKGDRVVIYMPMIPEAVFAMLACARLGAPHSVVFGGFPAPELAVRIDDAQPKLIVAASCGVEPQRLVEYKPMLDEALALSHHKPSACLVKQRPELPAALGPLDSDWDEAVVAATPHSDCVPVDSNDPLYIFTLQGPQANPRVWCVTQQVMLFSSNG